MLEVFKLVGPVFLVAYFVVSVIHESNQKLKLAMLFFTSIAAFSQNFSFIYRNVHQVIQIVIILFSIISIIQRRRIHSTFIPLFIFLIFIIVSLFSGGIDIDSASQTINFIVIFFVTLFLFNTVSEKYLLQKLMSFIGGLGLILAILTIFEFLITGIMRAEATFANPNYLALYLGISFSIVFYFYSKLKLVSLGLILFAILLTGSRSAILIPLMVIFLNIWKQKFSYKKVSTIIIGILITLLIFNANNSRFNTDGINGSDAERIQFAIVAYNMILDHPFTGVGWGRFITEFSTYSSGIQIIQAEGGEVDVSTQERRVTHNDLLRIGAELGLIALFFVLIYIFICIYILIIKGGYGLDFIIPIWFGLLLFSLTHNNLNTALSWFFFLMPFFIYKNRWKFK